MLSRSLDMSFPGGERKLLDLSISYAYYQRGLESNLIRVNHSGLAIGLRRSSYL